VRCPIPVLKMTALVMKKEVAAGDTLVVPADCSTFEKDAEDWCQKMNKVLVVMRDDGPAKRCEIRI
jgi:TusA-related sulfurtransferase